MTEESPLDINSQVSTKIAFRNRRSDSDIRSAIDDIQQYLFDPSARKVAVENALKHLVGLTDSDIAFAITGDNNLSKNVDQSNTPYIVCTPESSSLIKSSAVFEAILNDNIPTSVTVYNDNIPLDFVTMFDIKHTCTALLIVPIVIDNSVRSLIVLSKSGGAYNAKTIERLNPFWGSLMCTIRSADAVKGNLVPLETSVKGNQFLSSLIHTSPSAILVVSQQHSIILDNPAAHLIFNGVNDYEKPDDITSLIGLPIENFVPLYDEMFLWSHQTDKFAQSALEKPPMLWREQKIFRLDGSEGQADITVFKYTHARETFTVISIVDVTRLVHLDSLAKSEHNHLLAIKHLIPIAVLRVNIEWRCTFANERWIEVSGLTVEETIGSQWEAAVFEADKHEMFAGIHQSLSTGEDYSQDIRLITPLGMISWSELNSKVLFNDNGRVDGVLITFTDISSRIDYQEKLKRVAELDSLTGLVNRGLLLDRLQQSFYVAERENAIVCLMFLDLDGFKRINDTLGHDYGDELLKQVAKRLENALRKNDTVARFGGDEFVILLGYDDHPTELSRVAENLINAIGQPYDLMDEQVKMTTSIGIATGTYTDSSAKLLLKQADSALYLAKTQGKNKYQLFDETLNSKFKQRSFLINQLRRGVKQGRFYLVYQAIVDTTTSQIVGAEAFMRFTDVNERTMLPEDFIRVLDESGLIHEVGAWSIQEMCRTLQSLIQKNALPADFCMSINVTSKQLLEPSLKDAIVSATREFGVPSGMLAIEFDESFFEYDNDNLRKALLRLQNIGVKVIVDQFGSVQASLNELLSNYFDEVKLCANLTKQISEKPQAAIILKAIVELAKACGLHVVAEDNPSQELRDKLVGLGVAQLQSAATEDTMNKQAFKTLFEETSLRL